MNDGSDRVDWEKVEAILIVLGNNVYAKKLTRLFSDIWDSPFSGSWKGSFISSPSPDVTSLDAMDPYGVTGTWYRVRDLCTCRILIQLRLDYSQPAANSS